MRPQKTTKDRKEQRTGGKRPFWVSLLVVVSLTGMLFIAITYRSYSAVTAEVRENQQLNSAIEALTDENLQLQDEIHSLKTDPKIIEREAKRLGIAVKSLDVKTQVSVPAK